MNQFLRIYLRSIKNNPRLFLINIASFSVGIVAVMFIYLFVVKELSADKFHARYKDIYRIVENSVNSPSKSTWTPYPLGNLLKENHSEILDLTRYTDRPCPITIDEKRFSDQNICFVDRSFFNMFDFKLDVGDFNKIFENPNTVIIDLETAKKYFNTTDVLGKTFEIETNESNEKSLMTVVGILSEYSDMSTLQPHIISDIKLIEARYVDEYFTSSPQLFLYIPKCRDINQLSEKIVETWYGKLNDIRKESGPKQYEIDNKRMYLQNLADVYLHSDNISDDLPKGDFKLIWILISVGFIMLIITFVNYIILNVGIGLKNQKQNQIHRMLGGNSQWLRKKFITESLFYTVITFCVAMLLLPIVHKVIVDFSEYRYGLFSKSDLSILLSFFLLLIVFGAFSGFIQYLVLAIRKISEKEILNPSKRQTFFECLVPFQLFVFLTTIIGLLVIALQINYIRNQDLGFDANNTVTVVINDSNDKILFMQEFENKSYINQLSVGHTLSKSILYLDDYVVEDNQVMVSSQSICGDHNYVNTYNLEIVSGQNINGELIPPVNMMGSYELDNEVIEILVNQEFVKKSGLTEPLGTIVTIPFFRAKGRIVGIIKDVKNLPIYYSVTPVVIGYGINSSSIVASVKEGRMEDFKEEMENFIAQHGKESYIGYNIYNHDYEKWYKKEQTLMLLLVVFAVITFFILILGLIGISLFIAERKTKEIGVRKVNGARVIEILSMLNLDFIKWVVIAFIVACPVSYYLMQKWLESFAYKTSLSWWIFAISGILALGTALITVSWQSWRAAIRNPVEALRYE